MSLLEKIGLNKHTPSETILSSFTPDKEPYIAAIGVKLNNREKIKLNIYTNTQTYQNLQKSRAGAINIITDAEFLVKQSLSDIFSPKKDNLKFQDAKKVDAPYLLKADAVIEFKIKDIIKKTVTDKLGSSEMAKITGSAENIKIQNNTPHVFKRSELYLIEIAVLATKIIEAERKGKEEVQKNLMQKIKFFKNKCKKIAPQSNELKTISKITEYLNQTEEVSN